MNIKGLHSVICVTALLAGISGVARADDTIADPAVYKQKMHDCQTQMKSDHPHMNHDARHKACRKQLGPKPKAPKDSSAAPPASP